MSGRQAKLRAFVGNDDSCQYSNDASCDVPEYCNAGTDCSDCGDCSVPSTGAPPTPHSELLAPRTLHSIWIAVIQGRSNDAF